MKPRAPSRESRRRVQMKLRVVGETHGLWRAKRAGTSVTIRCGGVADGTRTRDNRNHNPGLYQLSYSHHRTGRASRKLWGPGRARLKAVFILACPTGLEPITPSLEGWCSIRLSYGQNSSQCRVSQAGRGERIRTSDILLPKQARYQAASHPGSALL